MTSLALNNWALGNIFRRRQIGKLSYFSEETGFYISCETVCMKYKILFSGKIKKNITNLRSTEFASGGKG